MLVRYPERLDWIAGTIGYLTRVKRSSMLMAFVVPHVVLVISFVGVRFGCRKAQPLA